MKKEIEKRIKEWLDGPFDAETKQQIRDKLLRDPQGIEDAFSQDLEFGTGGMRGVMDLGSNRMNVFTIAKASYGVGKYFLSLHPKKSLLAVIGYDCRHHSFDFSKKAATTLAALGIEVILTSHLRPTPFVSFLIRHRKADFGIMITASHNPKNYNGFKVYGSDGAQLVLPDDSGVEAIVKNSHFSEIPLNAEYNHDRIKVSKNEDDLAYLKALYELSIHRKQSLDFGKSLSILYTNLHGTGLTLLPYAMKQIGFENLHFVQKQTAYDGDFSFAPSPNPEDKKALELGLKQMEEEKHDLFLATDPDADRLAAVVLHQGKPHILTGNDMAAICLEHLLYHAKQNQTLTQDKLVISTIVSTRLLKKIADEYEVHYEDVLTGFKYIGEKIRKLDEKNCTDQFFFGAEESYGFLYGTYARDKDGLAASCLIAEIALHYFLKGKTLVDVLDEIYRNYGLIKDSAVNIDLGSGSNGLKIKEKIMTTLLSHEIHSFDNMRITKISDYEKGYSIDVSTGMKEPIYLPKTSAIAFELEDETSLIIRPSGTEPKIKIYGNYLIKSFLDIQEAKIECQLKLKTRLENVRNTLLSLV